MTYGIEKITATKAVESILEVVKAELMRQEAFSNKSMAYYGIEFGFSMDFKFHARKETDIQMSGTGKLGELTDPEPEVIKLKRKTHRAGRKIVVEPGAHTRDLHGEAV